MSATVRDILVAARARIADRRCWTRWHVARDRQGRTVAPQDDRAVRWCAIAAVSVEGDRSAIGYDVRQGALVRLRRAARQLGHEGPSQLNDRAGHAAVLEMFDAAIRDEREGRT